MAEGEAVRSQLVLELWTEGPALDQCRSRGPVHLQDAPHVPHVDGYRARVSLADVRLDPARHRGSAAVGDSGHSGPGRPVQHRAHLLLRARVGHEVRGVLVLPSQAAHEVPERLAQGVFGPLPGPRRAEARQRARRRDPRRPQPDLLQSGRLGGFQP